MNRWKCRCACGEERDVSDRGLRYGGSLSCGCLRKERAYEENARDLTGQRFGKLLVVSKRASGGQGGCRWICRCDCGKEVVYQGTLLMTGKRTCCGCQRRKHDMELKELLPHVDGTSICHLRSKKMPKNNTTGVKGVYLIRGRYVAKIVFQKKQYLLGTYDNLADAAEARKEAEEALHDQVATFYDRWQEKAKEDREWADENPIRISVVRRNGALHVELLPRMQ